MKQKNIAWKLVRVTSSKRMISSNVNDEKDQVEYKFGKWTKPNENAINPFLFVFDTRKSARNWKVRNHSERVVKVLVKNLTSERIGKRRCDMSSRPFNSCTMDIKGTMFADEVKVVGRG